MVQNGTDIELTKRQIYVAQTLLSVDVMGNVQKCSEVCDVPRTTIYRYLKDEEFKAYLKVETEALEETLRAKYLAGLGKSLVKGDIATIKWYKQMKDGFVEKTKTEAKEDITVLTTEEKKRGFDMIVRLAGEKKLRELTEGNK